MVDASQLIRPQKKVDEILGDLFFGDGTDDFLMIEQLVGLGDCKKRFVE